MQLMRILQNQASGAPSINNNSSDTSAILLLPLCDALGPRRCLRGAILIQWQLPCFAVSALVHVLQSGFGAPGPLRSQSKTPGAMVGAVKSRGTALVCFAVAHGVRFEITPCSSLCLCFLQSDAPRCVLSHRLRGRELWGEQGVPLSTHGISRRGSVPLHCLSTPSEQVSPRGGHVWREDRHRLVSLEARYADCRPRRALRSREAQLS
jgi:hypothetical protein